MQRYKFGNKFNFYTKFPDISAQNPSNSVFQDIFYGIKMFRAFSGLLEFPGHANALLRQLNTNLSYSLVKKAMQSFVITDKIK